MTDNPGGGAREAPFIAMLEGELGHVVVNKAALSNYAAYNGNPGVLPDPAMYDLIIFGGCTNSSNYCDGGGTTYVKEKAWNALAKPIMTMNGGVPLTSRWGWVNTAGSATLTGVTTLDTPILNASHPFVNGRTTSLYLPGATVYPPRQPGRR